MKNTNDKELSSYKYGELRGTVRFILDQSPDTASYFNEGKNYTTKSGDILRTLLEEYTGEIPNLEYVTTFIAAAKANKGVKTKKVKAVKEEVKEVIKEEALVEEPAKEVAEESAKEPIAEQQEKKAGSYEDTLFKAVDTLDSISLKPLSKKLNKNLSKLVEKLVVLWGKVKNKEEEEEKKRQEEYAKSVAEEKANDESNKLRREFESLRHEFKDVKHY